jgi:hypothetical protein
MIKDIKYLSSFGKLENDWKGVTVFKGYQYGKIRGCGV